MITLTHMCWFDINIYTYLLCLSDTEQERKSIGMINITIIYCNATSRIIEHKEEK